MKVKRGIIIFILLLISCAHAGHIYNWETTGEYDYEGKTKKFTLNFKLESGLGNSDFVKLIWPLSLGTYAQCKAQLYYFDNNQKIGNEVQSHSTSGTNNIYFFQFGQQIRKQEWVKMVITTDIDQAPGIHVDPISMQTVSDTDAKAIIYDMSDSMGHLFIHPNLSGTPLTVDVEKQAVQAIYEAPWSTYFIDIDINPSIQMENGAYFHIQIVKNGHSEGSSGNDFKFTGSCQSIKKAANQAQPVEGSCQISEDQHELVFHHKQGYSGTDNLSLRVQIQNPIYSSIRDIQVFVINPLDGSPVERGTALNKFTVQTIQLKSNSRVIKYYWGIPENEAGLVNSEIGTIPLVPFKALNGGKLGPLNSLFIGFETDLYIPIGSEFIVKIKLEANGVLEGSFLTNLPSASDQPVRCSYTSPYIKCINVGALVQIDFQYYIAVKAFYAHDASDPLLFGQIEIESVAYDKDGSVLSGVNLFDTYAGKPITLAQNKEFLDSGTDGWHSRGHFGLGTTQIVSFYDDGTLRATPNAIEAFLEESEVATNKVGIFPRDSLENDQQLLFFLKVDAADIGNSATVDEQGKMEILFNSQQIKLKDEFKVNQSSGNLSGIDFAAYHAANSNWDLDKFSCFAQNKCVQYDKETIYNNNNMKFQTETDNDRVPYGMVNFECGTRSHLTQDVQAHCNSFLGRGTNKLQDGNQGIFSMRHIQFDSDFHSSIYPDQKLLDFVIGFSISQYTSTTVNPPVLKSAQLINAYSLDNTYLSNIRVSYVNYYGESSSHNDGSRIPMMLRVSGTVLNSEHLGKAKKMGIFVDNTVNASNFFDKQDDKEDYGIGCSSADCEYFGNEGIASYPEDSWGTNKMILASNLPNIENEFNILVPFENSDGTCPTSVSLAFFDESHTAITVPNKLNTVSVYRVFGPTVKGPIHNTLGNINDMNTAQTAGLDFSTGNWGTTLNYQIDRNKISPGGEQDTLVKSNDTPMITNAGKLINRIVKYGAGVTITSVHYDIFKYARVSFFRPVTGLSDCTSFSYARKNTVEAYLDSKRIYTCFCPLDAPFDISNTDADIKIENPRYPSEFVEKYPLTPILTYAISDDTGNLLAFKKQLNTVESNSNVCISEGTSTTIHSTSPGKQKVKFPMKIQAELALDSASINGYSKFKVVQTLSGAVSQVVYGSACELEFPKIPNLACTYANSGTDIAIDFTLSSGDFTIEAETELIIAYYVTVHASTPITPTSGITYTLELQLPSLVSSVSRLYGTDFESAGSRPIFCKSQEGGQFKLSAQPLGTGMKIGSLQNKFKEKGARGEFQFTFKSLSPREFFYSTSFYELDFGFLQDPNTDLISNNNFRFVVYEKDAENISFKWKWIDMTSFPVVQLLPKMEIEEPGQYDVVVRCFGGATANDGGSQSSPLIVKWGDASDTIQEDAVGVTYPTSIITDSKAFGTAPVLQTKTFSTQGFEAFYTFQLRSGQNLNQFSRIYVEFSSGIPVRLNRDGDPECYLRQSSSDFTQSYCVFVQDSMLQIWVNKEISSGTDFYLDILGVDQPKETAIDSANSKIWIGIDTDDDSFNGISEHGEIVDVKPSNTALTQLRIDKISISNDQIRSTQDISFEVQLGANTVVAGNSMYIDFARDVTETIARGQEMTCTFINKQAVGTPSYLNSCSFLSKRRLKVAFNADAANSVFQNYQFTITSLPTPSQVPEQAKNSIRFIVFIADHTDASLPIKSIGYDYKQSYTKYKAAENLIELTWKAYQVFKNSDDKVMEEQLNTSQIEVFKGYYKRTLELSTKDESIFKTDFQFQMIHNDKLAFDQETFQVVTGSKNLRFKVAAKQDTEPGVYSLQASKTSGDSYSEYSNIQPLSIVVRGQACQITSPDSTYYIPIGGSSLPIILDYFNCFPLNDITITPSFSTVKAVLDSNFENGTINNESKDTRVIFVAKGGDEAVAGDTVTMTFAITGTNADSFVAPDPIQLIFVDPTTGTYKNRPIGTQLSGEGAVQIQENTAQMTIQCDQPSIIYWAIGVGNSTNTMTADSIEKKLKNDGGFLANYTEPQDYDYWRVYGQEIISMSIPVDLTFTGLKSNSEYSLKYFCKNQLNLVSKDIVGKWKVPNNGGYLMKLSVWIENQLKYSQITDIACSLSRIFKLKAQRIFTELSNICGEVPTLIGSGVTVDQLMPRSKQERGYVYQYYIIPDASLSSDRINLLVQEEIADKKFNSTLVAKLSDPAGFPAILDIQSEEGDQFVVPELNVAQIHRSLKSLEVDIQLKNTKGFVYAGIIEGGYDKNKDGLPSLENLKDGKVNSTQFYQNSGVRFVAQDSNAKINFSNLQINTEYTLVMAGANDDPSHLSKSPEVQVQVVKTLDVQKIIYAGGQLLKYNIAISLLLLLGLVLL